MQEKKGAKRQVFTSYEDARLKLLVDQFGDNSWQLIAHYMPSRTPRQCRERYKGYLDNSIKNLPWTQAEDNLLIEKYQIFGRKWAKITKFFNGRSNSNVKNRWTALLHFNPTVQKLNEMYLNQSKDGEHESSDSDAAIPPNDASDDIVHNGNSIITSVANNTNITNAFPQGSLVTMNQIVQSSNSTISHANEEQQTLPSTNNVPQTSNVSNDKSSQHIVKRHVIHAPLVSNHLTTQNSSQSQAIARVLLQPNMFWNETESALSQVNSLTTDQQPIKSYGTMYKNYGGKLW